MKDPRESLYEELLKLRVNKHIAAIIALDAGSSQCVVNKEYLKDMGINKYILDKVHKKVIDFYCGELAEL
ncbi:MAG: hypothetical protein V3V16_10710 [Melioribacteraceae bacterium]